MPKLKDKRISGTYDLTTKEGKNGVGSLQYCKQEGKKAWIDTDAIKAKIDEYIAEKEHIEIDEKTGKEITIQEPVSWAGLRIKLNICPSTYDLYLKGYVSYEDSKDENVIPNQNLMKALRAGEDFLLRYMSEQGGKYDQTRCIRFLESKGEIAPQKQQIDANIKVLSPKWKGLAK